MLHFYDAQIRRYLLQIIRLLSNFSVKYGDGTLVRVPVAYGDSDRQVAHIINQNSENTVAAAPRIAVYISELSLDRSRLSDATHVSKVHLRERDVEGGVYNSTQGRGYTVERLMPTPFKMTVKVDIWSSSTDQKLQILEQILVFFNPSLEIQTTDNYVDWTSLSVVDLTNMTYSNRSIPVGTNSNIDICTLTLDTPIWISTPAKVKQLGVVTSIIAGINQMDSQSSDWVDSLGDVNPTYGNSQRTSPYYPSGSAQNAFVGDGNLMLNVHRTTIQNYNIVVVNSQARLLDQYVSTGVPNDSIDVPLDTGEEVNWRKLLDRYPGQYRAGASKIYLVQNDGSEVVGTVALNPLDETILTISWDADSYPTNSDITSLYRPLSPGTFDAIVNPLTVGPNHGLPAPTVGTRYLIIESIGDAGNADGADAWKGADTSDLVAEENDIIEWDGTRWQIIFDASASSDQLIYQTNIYTGVQYKWNGQSWVKSFEGEYRRGTWRLEL